MLPFINLCMCVCMRAKSAALSFFQHAISPGYHEPLLPNTQQVGCVLSTTQAWATRACATASVCTSKPYVSTWISPEYCYIYNDLYVLTLTAIPSRPYMGMLDTFQRKRLTLFLPVVSHCGLWVWSHGGSSGCGFYLA